MFRHMGQTPAGDCAIVERGSNDAFGRSMKTALALFLIVWLSAAHAQTLYKSIGPDGKVVYSDRPPAEGRVDKTLQFENLPSSAVPAATLSYVEQLKRMKQSALPPTNGLVLYSAAWCGYCRKAKAFLAGKGVSYQEIDIDTPDGKAAFAQAGGGRGVPLLLVNGQKIQGFSPEAYEFALAGGR
ncbi:glutaredoxin family protein [Aquincola sp. S2]|uniref:Glutaredoxin family protein n=1 Tax=Pseudaquabacterium terrae TaxID=2732868 RepID=A0ABX2ECF1_9BURK|nr:glutaredoxin family protein [Aquabacterium terrae]NRF65500.1 glutaredoxin family protein [Aquabacterium terrae]